MLRKKVVGYCVSTLFALLLLLIFCINNTYAGDIKIFDKIVYSNIRFPEKNGSYVCRATKLSISEHGIKRTSTLAWLEN